MNAILPQVVSETARQMEALLREYPELEGDEQLRVDTFDGETSLNGVLKRLCNVLNSTDALLEGVRVDAEQLSKRRNRFMARKDAARDMIRQLMEAGKMDKLELSNVTLSLKAKPRSVVITDESALPVDMFRYEAKPKRDEIKKALLAGKEVPGAQLDNGGISVTVRQS